MGEFIAGLIGVAIYLILAFWDDLTKIGNSVGNSVADTASNKKAAGGGGHDPRNYSFENDYGGYGNDTYVNGNFVDF